MTNHFLASASNTSGEDVSSLNDAAIVTGTSSTAAALMELRWSDTATGGSSYVVRRRDLIEFCKRLIIFIDSNGALDGTATLGTDLPVN